MKKFLILGGNSRLAQCIKMLYPDYAINIDRNQCDISIQTDIFKVFNKYPDIKYVINCAALTDIEQCEKKPDKCFKVNVLGTYFLNSACQKFNKKLIHISSDYATSPKNTYGWSKMLSEKLIDCKFLIISTNFYDKETYVINKLLNNEKTEAFSNVYLNPISVNRLAKEIVQNLDKSGFLRIYSEKKLSWYKFGQLFCLIFRKNSKLLTKTIYEDDPLRAHRPLSSYTKTDIKVSIEKDLIDFNNFLNK